MSRRPGRLPDAARALLPYIALAAGLLAVYHPVLRADFLFNDDYTNFVRPPSFEWLLGGVGRPVQYVLASWTHRFIRVDLERLLIVRVLLFALWVTFASVIFGVMRRGLGAANALALVLFAFSVPTFLVTFGWLSVAVNVPAYLAAAGSYATGYLLLGPTRSGLARAALSIATVLLVALASLTYQLAVVLPLVLVAYHLLHEARERRWFGDAAVLYALVMAGIALSLVVLRIFLREAHLPVEARLHGVAERLTSWRALLLPLRLLDANAAMHYYYWGWMTREGALVIGAGLSALVARTVWREVTGSDPDRPDRRVRWALIAVAFLAGGMLFVLDASRELRSKPFLTLLALVLASYAIGRTRAWQRLGLKHGVKWAVVALTMWSGHHTLSSGLVASAVEELRYVREALARADLSEVRRVHLIQPDNHCFSAPCYGNFEFAMKLSSSLDWVPDGMIRVALAQRGHTGDAIARSFSRGPPDDARALVIDMRDLSRRLYSGGELLDLDRYLKRRKRGTANVVGMSGQWIRVAAPDST